MLYIKQTDYYLSDRHAKKEKNTQVKKLSKGMKQKVLLVRALLHSPKILFLDEPTSGLDPASADTIHRILRELNDQGITILLTSHNMEEVDKLCNRVAFLNQGEIVEMGSPEALKLDHSNRRIKVLIDDGHGLGIAKELDMDSKESARPYRRDTEGKVVCSFLWSQHWLRYLLCTGGICKTLSFASIGAILIKKHTILRPTSTS